MVGTMPPGRGDHLRLMLHVLCNERQTCAKMLLKTCICSVAKEGH